MTAEDIGRLEAVSTWMGRKSKESVLHALCEGRLFALSSAKLYEVSEMDTLLAFERGIERARRKRTFTTLSGGPRRAAS